MIDALNSDFGIIAIFIASISVVVAILSFILSFKKSKGEQLLYESQFIANIQNTVDQSDFKLINLKTKTDCTLSAWGYLNTIDRLCYFDSKKRLTKDIIEYFKNYLGWALVYYDWCVSVGYRNEVQMTQSFPYILKTCKKHNIEKPKDELPQPFRNFNSLPEK